MAASRFVMPQLSGSLRHAVLTADLGTGMVSGPPRTRSLLIKMKIARKEKSRTVLTAYGRRVRTKLDKTVKPFSLNGLSYDKVEEIVTLYRAGRSLKEVCWWVLATRDDVMAALEYKRVLVGARESSWPLSP